MNFDPQKLIKDIPDDMRGDVLAEQNNDFIAQCKADGDTGADKLRGSAACSLALNLYLQLRAVLKGTKYPQVRALFEALSPRDRMIAMQAAVLGFGMALQDDARKNIPARAKPEKREALSHSVFMACIDAVDLGSELSGPIQDAMESIKAARSSGKTTFDSEFGILNLGIVPPKPKDQPPQT